jgi:hypothetical protein
MGGMMCSDIDARTRENPESAMLHNTLSNQLREPPPTFDQIKDINPAETPLNRALAARIKNPDPDAKGVQGFDSEAHRAFMRSLG